MKVQIVAKDAAQAAEQFRPEEQDLSDLDYQGADENSAGGLLTTDGGLAGRAPAPSAAAQPIRHKVTMGHRNEADEPKMNRADRRKIDKRKR